MRSFVIATILLGAYIRGSSRWKRHGSIIDAAPRGAPLLFLVGERDDWTGAAPCVDHVNRVREAGYVAKLVVYAGAEHAFDYAGRFRQYLAQAESWAACNYIAGDTHFRVVASGMLVPWSRFAEYLQGCTSSGAHIGSNALAARQARDELDRFLLETLAGGAAR